MKNESERRAIVRSARRRGGRRSAEQLPPLSPAMPDVAPAVFPGGATADGRVAQYLDDRFRARDVKVWPLSGDASTRRYYRVAVDGELSVLSLNPEPFDADQLSFVIIRHLMAGWGLPVPEIRDMEGALGILLLQDLGDLTLQEALKGARPAKRKELYRQALDQLVVLQREAAGAPQRAVCFQVAFDFEKLSWELHFFWKHFLEAYRKCDLSVEDRASVADGFHRLCAEIASWPRVMCHRDFHSRNLMSHAERLWWIDFQDARMGPVTYDLASLLRDSYVDLVAAGGPLVVLHLARQLQGRFLSRGLRRRPRRLRDRRAGHDGLCETAAVAHDQELDLAARALVVEPALHAHFLSHVAAEVGDANEAAHRSSSRWWARARRRPESSG